MTLEWHTLHQKDAILSHADSLPFKSQGDWHQSDTDRHRWGHQLGRTHDAGTHRFRTNPPDPRGGFRGRTENGVDVAHHENADLLLVQRALWVNRQHVPHHKWRCKLFLTNVFGIFNAATHLRGIIWSWEYVFLAG